MSSTFTRLIMFDSNFISRFSFHTLCFDHLINFFVVEQRTMCLLLLELSDAQATHYMISNKQSFVCTKLLIRFRIKCALPFSITVVTTKSQTPGQTFFYQIIHKLRIEGAKNRSSGNNFAIYVRTMCELILLFVNRPCSRRRRICVRGLVTLI